MCGVPCPAMLVPGREQRQRFRTADGEGRRARRSHPVRRRNPSQAADVLPPMVTISASRGRAAAALIAIVAVLGCLYLFESLQTRTKYYVLIWNVVGLAIYLLWARRKSLLEQAPAG